MFALHHEGWPTYFQESFLARCQVFADPLALIMGDDGTFRNFITLARALTMATCLSLGPHAVLPRSFDSDIRLMECPLINKTALVTVTSFSILKISPFSSRANENSTQMLVNNYSPFLAEGSNTAANYDHCDYWRLNLKRNEDSVLWRCSKVSLDRPLSSRCPPRRQSYPPCATPRCLTVVLGSPVRLSVAHE